MRIKIIQTFLFVLFSSSIVFSQDEKPEVVNLHSFYDSLTKAEISVINYKKQIKLEDLKARTLVIVFFASWCNPCMFQAEEVNKINKKFSKLNFQAVGISSDIEDRKDFRRLSKSHKFNYFLGEMSESATEFLVKELIKITKVDAIPYTILIDNGEIKDIFVGVGASRNKKFKESLNKIINESNNRTNQHDERRF